MEIFAADSIGRGRGRGCDNNRCPARNSWPLHHVSHRANLRLLCTSCVLRQHHGFFCSLCLQLLDSPPLKSPSPAPANIARCLRCPAAAHTSCIPNASLPNFLCPVCENPEGFSYFPVGDNGIDAGAARALLSASRIAAASMSRAAAAARLEAERRMRMAAAARETAREVVERVMVVSVERTEENEGTKIGDLKVKKKKKKKKKRRKKMIAFSSPSGLLKNS